MREGWPVAQLRIARPTARMEAVVRFHRDGLVLPDRAVHLELTEHEHGSPCPAPTKDNLLVLYVPDRRAPDDMLARVLVNTAGLGAA